MHSRAAELIGLLDLAPHPEGGWFREIHRAGQQVVPSDGRAARSALTSIYFLLAGDEVSRWHRVASDEAWHFHEGDPLELLAASATFETVTRHVLGPASGAVRPTHVVPANTWQAARSFGTYTLVACSVGWGFDFADFALLRDSPAVAAEVVRQHPQLARFV